MLLSIRHRFTVSLTVMLALWSTACALSAAPPERGGGIAASPSLSELRAALQSEFERLGIDPDKVPAAAPRGETNRTFQIVGALVDPDGPAGPIPGQTYLGWVEQAVGDFDQNGEVNAADLTPLGAHFSEQVTYRPAVDGLYYWPLGSPDDDGGVPAGDAPAAGSPAENWRLARIDGDGNGELNIADITSIALHWQERISGWRIYRSSSSNPVPLLLPNPVDAGLPYTFGRDQATTFSGGQLDPHRPVTFQYAEIWIPTEVWERFYVVPYDAMSDEEGARSVIVELHLDGSAHLVPSASITATHNPAILPWAVHWSAEGSYDVDGTIAKYEWDAGNDGTYEVDSGTTPFLDSTYPTPGLAVMTVRVTDNEGLTDTATTSVMVGGDNQAPTAAISVDVSEDWAPFYVTFDPTTSSDPDGTITAYDWDLDGDGNIDRSDPTPVVFQHHYTVPGIYDVELTVVDDLGASDSASQTITAHGWVSHSITSSTETALHISAAMVDGHPALAWITQSTPGSVYVSYTRAADADGERWDAGISSQDWGVSSSAELSCSLAVTGGVPAIAFIDGIQQVRYLRASDSQGNNWPAAASIVTGGPAANSISLVEVDGAPAIAFAGDGADAGKLFYIRSSTADGSFWGAGLKEVSAGPADGRSATLLPFDEPGVGIVPLILHWNDATFEMKFEQGDDADGGSWQAQRSIAPADLCKGNAAAALISGSPAFVCYGSDSVLLDGLWYRRAAYSAGPVFDWSTPLAKPANGYASGHDCSLAQINGNPAAAWAVENTGHFPRLAYCRADDADGTGWNSGSYIEADADVDNTLDVVLMEMTGNPGAAFVQYDGATYTLKFARGI